jgi:hypothetical protein
MAEIDRLRAELDAMKAARGPVSYTPPQRVDESNDADAAYSGGLRISDSTLASMKQPGSYRRKRDFGGSEVNR